MRIKQLFLSFALTLVGAVTLTMAAEPKQPAYFERTIKGFTNLYENGIDEKLYLQTDKPYYSAGEKIWFKGYLVNAITHSPFEITNFIYVELQDRLGNLVSRVKVKRSASGFDGYIILDPTMKEGDYTIRAYTKWMTNKSSDYFFTKNIQIVSPIPPSSGAEPEPLSKRVAAKKAAAEAAEASRKLDYDLQFFPEGGVFLAGTPQLVAFKALAEDGLSMELSGKIYNSKVELIAEFETSHKGMGLMNIAPIAGETYYAIAESKEGLQKRFELPAVDVEGATLKVSHVGRRFFFQVSTTNTNLLKGSYILIHSRGRVVTVDDGYKSTARFISEDSLQDGVSVISLMSADNKVLAERVIFKRPSESEIPQLSFVPSSSNYARRALAKMRIEVKGSNGLPAQGEFGVSVTDDSSIAFDEADGDILSYLLLSSEIRGHIEEPGLYFSGDLSAANRNLDLLMRTQGWRRFNLEKVVTQSLDRPKVSYEDEVGIHGDVKGFFGNAARAPKIYVLAPTLNYVDMFDLDASSSFDLMGLNIPDSTTYIIQARGRKGGNTLTLKVSPEAFPKSKAGVFEREEVKYIPTAFVAQSQDKFFYEGGMNMINLEAVTVTTTKKELSEEAAYATNSTSREDLEAMPGMTFDMIVRSMPGMSVSEEGLIYRGSTSMVRILVDGMDYEFVDAMLLTSDDMEEMNFYSGADAAMYSNAAGGVLDIKMRESFKAVGVSPPNIAYIDRLGYQRADQFYQPKYENPSLKANLPPDYRTTIFWSGALTPDENGVITFEYFTADKPTTYTITVEGVTTMGEICRGTTVVERTVAGN